MRLLAVLFLLLAGSFGLPAAAVAGPVATMSQVPGDADGDGFDDEYDTCPTLPGSPDAQGCPDSDGDWIADQDDACPTVRGDGEGRGTGCPDEDGDGVNDPDDECKDAGGKVVAANGCPPVYGTIGLRWRSIGEMVKGGPVITTCRYTAGVHCEFRPVLKLSKASARRLGVSDRVLFDKTFKTTRSASRFHHVSEVVPWKPSNALRNALKRVASVTITFTATYRVGDGVKQKLPTGTFVLKRSVSDGPPPDISDRDGGSIFGPGVKRDETPNEAGETS